MKKEFEELKKQVEENISKLDSHLEMIQKNSMALEILGDYKQGTKRAFTLALVFAVAFILTLGVLLTLILLNAI